MSEASFRFARYAWRGGSEWMLAREPSAATQIVLIPPLFEEMNFTRTLLAELMRALAERDVSTWLPDLPGTGESERPLALTTWDDWRDAARGAGEAVAALTGARPFSCAFRGGALLDDAVDASGRWRYAPVAGEALLRRLRRAQIVADREAGIVTAEESGIVEYAGYPLSPEMRAGLAGATPAPGADREVAALPGGAPWRRAEPAGDRVLAQELADDIARWIATCANR